MKANAYIAIRSWANKSAACADPESFVKGGPGPKVFCFVFCDQLTVLSAKVIRDLESIDHFTPIYTIDKIGLIHK